MNLATKSRTKTAILSLLGLCLLASDALAATNRPLSSLPAVTAALGNDEILLNRPDGTNWTAIRGPITNTIHKNPMFYGTVTAAENIHLATSNGITAGGQGHYIIAQGANELTALYSGGTARQIIYQDKIRFDLPLYGDGKGLTNLPYDALSDAAKESFTNARPAGSLAHFLNTNSVTGRIHATNQNFYGGEPVFNLGTIYAPLGGNGVFQFNQGHLSSMLFSNAVPQADQSTVSFRYSPNEVNATNGWLNLDSVTVYGFGAGFYAKTDSDMINLTARGSHFIGQQIGAGTWRVNGLWQDCIFETYQPEATLLGFSEAFESNDFSTNRFLNCVFRYGGDPTEDTLGYHANMGAMLYAHSWNHFKDCWFICTTNTGTGTPLAVHASEGDITATFEGCTFEHNGGLVWKLAGSEGAPVDDPRTYIFRNCFVQPYTNTVLFWNTNGTYFVTGGNITAANFSNPELVTFDSWTIGTNTVSADTARTNGRNATLNHFTLLGTGASTTPYTTALQVDLFADQAGGTNFNLLDSIFIDGAAWSEAPTSQQFGTFSFTFPLQPGATWYYTTTNSYDPSPTWEQKAFWSIEK